MNAVTLYRVGRWCKQRHVPIIPKLTYYVIFVLFNSVVPMSAEIGEDTYFGHGGIGVVLHPRCRIGKHVLIGAQVTIGGRSRLWGVPTIEDHCCIGAGAKILGPIRVGEGAVIGANAVVIHDVPPFSVAAGVPAKVIRKDIHTDDYAYV